MIRARLFCLMCSLLMFAAGERFEHWMHRPIKAGGFTVQPWLQPTERCFEDRAGTLCGQGETTTREPTLHPYGKYPWERELCRWYDLCQQET